MAKVSPKVVESLDKGYEALRRNHPDLPAMLILVETPHPAVVHRIGYCRHDPVVTASGLYDGSIVLLLPPSHRDHLPCAFDKGAPSVFEVLVHEAAHALARARGIKDTSRGGSYHNKRFRDLAVELGLAVEASTEQGFAHTRLTPETEARYARQLKVLDDALVLRKGG